MINSVAKALNLLLFINDAGEAGLTLVELADLSGLKVPTAFNLLGTLEQEGFLEREPVSRRYHIGPKARHLGQRQGILNQLSDFCAHELIPLSRELEETLILAVFHAMKRRTLVAMESTHLLRVCAQEGEDQNFYNTATGRILLSMLPQEALSQLCLLLGPPVKDWPEISDNSSLQSALSEIKKEGAVVFFPKNTHQLQALAVPLRFDGAPLASLGVFYPISRHPSTDDTNTFLKKMKEAAALLQQKWRRFKHFS